MTSAAIASKAMEHYQAALQDFAELCGRALQPGAAVPGLESADESGAPLEHLSEAGPA